MAFFHKSFYILFFALLSSSLSSQAYTFNVGGKDGWTLHPSENYNQWSSRLRFIVGDMLHFKGSDSVLEVNNGDYDDCNTNNPITTLTGGDSFFNLNRTGPFYFISGNKTNCDQGQKLKVVVITPKKKAAAPAPATFPTVPTGSPVASPPQSGTTVPTTPAASPGGGASSSPTGSPMGSPAGGGPSSSPTGSPAASPGGGPSSSPTGSPTMTPSGGPSSSPTGNPADVNAPAPGGSPSSLSARVAVSGTLTVFVGLIIFWFINLCFLI